MPSEATNSIGLAQKGSGKPCATVCKVMPAGEACQGCLVVALLEHRSQALAHSGFSGLWKAAKPSVGHGGVASSVSI